MNLYHYKGITTTYDAKIGLSRHLKLTGQIDDKWYDAYYFKHDSLFHQKTVCLEIHSPPNPESIEEERANFMGGVGKLCGVAKIKAGVIPESFEINGVNHELEPVYVDLFLSHDAFAVINDQALDAFKNQFSIRATIILVGDALQQIKRDKTMPLLLKPRELDTTVFNGYGVKSIEIFTKKA